MSDVYRRMTMIEEKKPEFVQISPTVSIRRDLILQVYLDGTVARTDGLMEKGDPERLREEGLL
jgi:hypothetical protein